MNELNQFNFRKETRHCPKCNNTEFIEHDCGPDTYEDDITYTSFSCIKCGLWFDGWISKWYENVTSWSDTEGEEPYETKEADGQ